MMESVKIEPLEEGYSDAFVNDVALAMKQYDAGDYVVIENPADVWASVD